MRQRGLTVEILPLSIQPQSWQKEAKAESQTHQEKSEERPVTASGTRNGPGERGAMVLQLQPEEEAEGAQELQPTVETQPLLQAEQVDQRVAAQGEMGAQAQETP